jgi:hypothetical protein
MPKKPLNMKTGAHTNEMAHFFIEGRHPRRPWTARALFRLRTFQESLGAEISVTFIQFTNDMPFLCAHTLVHFLPSIECGIGQVLLLLHYMLKLYIEIVEGRFVALMEGPVINRRSSKQR